jgi:hypothetical protein
MKENSSVLGGRRSRRGFLKNGMIAAGAAAGVGMLPSTLAAFDREEENDRAPLTKGDIAILTFLQALEQVEADLWTQYSELGGVQDNEVSGVNGGNAPYMAALQILDGDMPQYIHDNTDDELSHAAFLGKYLESKGASSVNLDDHFRVFPSSQATGANQSFKKTGMRLTNLTQLKVDTSFWTRYRSITNPDFDPTATFAQATGTPDGKNSLVSGGRFTAIPRTDADTTDPNQINAIAFTAGFHFAFIEQGGSSLYPTLAQKVTNLEVLRILLSIGPSETMHFQTWQDKAGNANTGTPGGNPNFTFTDPINGSTVTFVDLHVPATGPGESSPEDTNAGKVLQANLIMPEPTHFLDPVAFPPVAIVRPTSTKLNGAVATVQGFVDDGLFLLDPKTGQQSPIVPVLMRLAEEADEARRRF